MAVGNLRRCADLSTADRSIELCPQKRLGKKAVWKHFRVVPSTALGEGGIKKFDGLA